MNKLHWVNISVCIVVLVITIFCGINAVALSYGFGISLLNFILSIGFSSWHQRRVSRYPTQSLIVVVQSMLVRFFVVGCLLVLGFGRFEFVPLAMMIGFIVGQFFYWFSQIIKVIKHGK